MSGFAVIYENSNTPVEPGVLERVMERLNHRGPDGSSILMAGHAALGHWHFWITPEEIGEKQPLGLDGTPFKIVLDGRLDNRPELLIKLNINQAEGSRLSDAALVLYAYDRWGEHCFENFIGEYALVILDERRGELLCARDSLGDRTLFYSFKGTRLVLASEPWAVAGADGSSVELNESAVAYYFALEAPEDGQTLFKNIYELLPAHVMRITASGQLTRRYWQPDPSIRLLGKSDEEYAAQFRSLLEESVRCRLRSTTPVGVLMSGGLDSTSITCLAVPMVAPKPLTTISYVFDDLKDCDERQYIEAVKNLYGIRSIQIPCDDAWPLKDWQHWPFDPGQPAENPFRCLKERAYDRARKEGLRVLLTGGFGDHLYAEGIDCFADLLSERRLLDAIREFGIRLGSIGLSRNLYSGFLERIGKRFFKKILGVRHLFHDRNTPRWLTPFAADFLNRENKIIEPDLTQQVSMLGRNAAQSSSREIPYASRYALDLRHPYRDRRLIEYVLSLPSYQLYYHGLYKHVLRTAMQGILPESIRTRRQPTAMNSLFLRGVEREKKITQDCAQDPGAEWRKYVRSRWLKRRWKFTPDQTGVDMFVPWLCVSYDLWYKELVRSSEISGVSK